MRAKIRLDKETVVRLFCYSCEGYRSVHRALQEGYWSAFQAYYTAEKRGALQALVQQLGDLTPEALRDVPPPTLDELSRITPSVGLFRVLLGRWLNKRKQSWSFAVPEIRFLTSTLQRLLDFLKRPLAPSPEELFSLQIQLCNCSGIFEMHGYGLAAIARARRIEHFDHTPWVPHVKLSDIVRGADKGEAANGPAAKAAG